MNELEYFDPVTEEYRFLTIEYRDLMNMGVRLRRFYAKEYPSLCDVTFICNDEKSVQGHRLLLSCVSDFFSLMFKKEPEKSTFEIHQFDSKIMEWIVKQVCVGDVSSKDHNLIDLITACDFFQIPNVIDDLLSQFDYKLDHCDFYRQSNSSCIDECIALLKLNELIDLPDFKRRCILYLIEHFEDIIDGQKLQALDGPTLRQILDDDYHAFEKKFDRMDPMTVYKQKIEGIYNVLKLKNQLETTFKTYLKSLTYYSNSRMEAYCYFFATGDSTTFSTFFEFRDAERTDESMYQPEHHLYEAKTDDYIIADPDLRQLLLSMYKPPKLPFTWNGLYTFWTETYLDVDNQIDWIIDYGKAIASIKIRYFYPDDPDLKPCIQGLEVQLDDDSIHSINMSQGNFSAKEKSVKCRRRYKTIRAVYDIDDALQCFYFVPKSDEYDTDKSHEITAPTVRARNRQHDVPDHEFGGKLIGMRGKYMTRDDQERVLTSIQFKVEFFNSDRKAEDIDDKVSLFISLYKN